MCAGGQKWDHLVTNEFALLSHSKIDEPSCEDFELLGRISLKDHCTLNMRTKKNTKNPSERFGWKLQSQIDTFFSERLSCCVDLFNIND